MCPSVDMLPFGVTIPATVPQRSEIPEGLLNYPVHVLEPNTSRCVWLLGIPMKPSSVDEDHSGLRLQSFPIAVSFFVTELH